MRFPSLLRRGVEPEPQGPSPYSKLSLSFRACDVRETADVILRGYAGGRTSRLAEGWTSVPESPDKIIREQLRTMRARARDAVQNYDHARRFRQLVISQVLGYQGIQLGAEIVDPDGQRDVLANEAIESAWTTWGRKENCDVEGQLSWTGLQRAILGTAAEDGEAFLRVYRGPQFGPFAFQLQLLDPELVDVSLDKPAYVAGGNYVRHGIEFDRFHRAVGYHVIDTERVYRDSSIVSYPWFGATNHTFVPAENMIHLFSKERAGQRRGIPWLSTPLLRLNMLQAYEDAAIVASRGGAAKMGHYFQEAGGRFTGDASEDPSDPENNPEIEEFEPGISRKLPPGVRFEGWDPSYPHEQFPAFVKSCLRSVAAGLGISYNLLANDLEGVTYSSLREGRLSDEDVWRTFQDWLIGDICEPVYRGWLRMALLAQAIPVASNNGRALGFLRLDREEKYQTVRWWPRTWKWVDPENEVSAAMEEIDHGVRSRGDYIRSRGGDPSRVFAEIEGERGRTGAPSNEPSETEE